MSGSLSPLAAEGKRLSDRLIAEKAARATEQVVTLADCDSPGQVPADHEQSKDDRSDVTGADEPNRWRGEVTTLADVVPERLEWLWPGLLPLGKLVTLDGDPSVGKSTVAVDWAARISTGCEWPDGSACSRGNVVILSAEDGLADTIRPRLDAANGDPSRVHVLTSVRAVDAEGNVMTRPPTLADIDVIRETITKTSARLLIVDVLMAYMPGKVDAHRDQDVRAVLHRLADMATTTGCTVLLLRHLNKSGGGSPMYRGGGSIGIVGAARAGYLIATDPDDESGQVRVLASVKNNLARAPESLSYRLEESTNPDVARVVWLGSSTHTAAGLLDTGNGEFDDRREVDRWLLDLITENGGTIPSKEVFKFARDAGFSADQAKRAKKRLPIGAVKGGMHGAWNWVLVTEESTKEVKSAGP
jgi:hypothetical protein